MQLLLKSDEHTVGKCLYRFHWHLNGKLAAAGMYVPSTSVNQKNFFCAWGSKFAERRTLAGGDLHHNRFGRAVRTEH
jgi:hypothetical protein